MASKPSDVSIVSVLSTVGPVSALAVQIVCRTGGFDAPTRCLYNPAIPLVIITSPRRANVWALAPLMALEM